MGELQRPHWIETSPEVSQGGRQLGAQSLGTGLSWTDSCGSVNRPWENDLIVSDSVAPLLTYGQGSHLAPKLHDACKAHVPEPVSSSSAGQTTAISHPDLAQPEPRGGPGSNTPPLLLRTRCCQPGPCAGSAGTPEDTTPCHRDQQATGETSQRGAPSRTGRRKRCFQKRPLRRMKPEDSLSVAICSARVFGVKTVKRGCGRGTPGADLQRRRVSLHWNGAESQRERSAVSSR